MKKDKTHPPICLMYFLGGKILNTKTGVWDYVPFHGGGNAGVLKPVEVGHKTPESDDQH